MTKEEWRSIKDGQIIYGRSGMRQVVHGCHNECIGLKAIRKTKFGHKTTTYTIQDARHFTLRRAE